MRAEPERLRQAPIRKVISDPEKIQSSVRSTYNELGCLLDEDSSAALLADVLCKDCPIVGVTRGFVELSGFSRDELLGKNCRVMLDGVPEVAVSKSARKNLRDFCRMCLFVGMSQIAEATSLQPNARRDGSPFMNFFMVGLCLVNHHPFILGVQMLVGEGLLARLSNKQIQEVTEESRRTLLRLRRLLHTRAEQLSGPPRPGPANSMGISSDAGFSFYSERLQDHCTLFSDNQRVVRREPHELATNCLVYGDAPVRWTESGLFFALKVDDIVSTFNGLPLLGFTRRRPVDAPDLYPPVTKCMGSSVMIGACGEAFARDKHEHFPMGFRPPPNSEVQTWSWQQDVPNHRREAPLTVSPGDELGCLYARSGYLQLWRNGQKAIEFDLGRPPEVGADYWAVVDVCFSVYSILLIARPPPTEEPPGADAAGGGVEVRRISPSGSSQDIAAGPSAAPPGNYCQCRLPRGARSLGWEDSCRTQSNGTSVAARYISAEAAERAISAAVSKCRFCVTVASHEDEVPLVAVSQEFEKMTGYSHDEILGKNCRFLNEGCFVSSQDLMGLRMSSSTGASFVALLPNRKKSGELFVNMLDLQGLAVARNVRTGEILWYSVGIQADVTEKDEETTPDRHGPERMEVARQIRLSLRQQSTPEGAGSRTGAPNSSFQLLDEPLWMHGPDWAKDAAGSGEKPATPICLEPTMPPGSKFQPEGSMEKTTTSVSSASPRSLRFRECSVRSFCNTVSEKGDASVRSFSKAYSEKAAQDEQGYDRRPSNFVPATRGGSTSEGTICLLKGWFAFSVPALGAMMVLLGSLLHRHWR